MRSDKRSKTMSDGSGAESEDDTLEENYYSILNVAKVSGSFAEG